MFGKAHDKFSKKIINDWEILFAKYLIPFLSKCIAFNIIVLKLIPKSKKTGSTPYIGYILWLFINVTMDM